MRTIKEVRGTSNWTKRNIDDWIAIPASSAMSWLKTSGSVTSYSSTLTSVFQQIWFASTPLTSQALPTSGPTSWTVKLTGKSGDPLLQFKTKCLTTRILDDSSIVKSSVNLQATKYMTSMDCSCTQATKATQFKDQFKSHLAWSKQCGLTQCWLHKDLFWDWLHIQEEKQEPRWTKRRQAQKCVFWIRK